MDVEERTRNAIAFTRIILRSVLDDPGALAFMTFYELSSGDLEDKIAEILKYLEKTAPEEAET